MKKTNYLRRPNNKNKRHPAHIGQGAVSIPLHFVMRHSFMICSHRSTCCAVGSVVFWQR